MRSPAAFYNLQEAKAAGAARETARLEAQLLRLQGAAEKFVVPNAYGAFVQQNGGADFNATTSHVSAPRHHSLCSEQDPKP